MQFDIRAAFKVSLEAHRWHVTKAYSWSEGNSLRNEKRLDANRTRGRVSDEGKEGKRIEFRCRLGGFEVEGCRPTLADQYSYRCPKVVALLADFYTWKRHRQAPARHFTWGLFNFFHKHSRIETITLNTELWKLHT